MDTGKLTLLVLFDLTKAFEYVNPRVILSTLIELGFFVKTISWFFSYLTNRSQAVLNDDGLPTEFLETTSGVPQGSVLGPILFLLVMNSVAKRLIYSRHGLFADDKYIYLHYHYYQLYDAIRQITTDAQAVADWAKDNGLEINVTKTKAMLLGSSGKLKNIQHNFLPPTVVNGIAIPFTESAKCLGLHITNTLSWNLHTSKTIKNLLPGQTASDRPDLVARVLSIKKDTLIDMIVKQHLFGQVAAYNWVIEFQKRGLPHLHMLITLKSDSKITTPEQVDRLISAEIPNPMSDPTLFDIVTKNMLHGPCGDWCLINNICSKKFPKQFRNETTMDGNGYLYNRRQDENITFSRNNFVFTNQHVVPYNKVLLKTFNCHINVKVVCSVTAVKYSFKYVYKGHNKAGITINGSVPNTRVESLGEETHSSSNSHDSENLNNVKDHDEVRDFVDARYIGPVEAVWRILSKHLQNKSHSIIRLPVHLPNEQSITINNDCNNDELREALQKQSMLIDYFKLNERDSNARQYIYSDILYHYVFKKDNVTKITSWQPRKKYLNVIGRKVLEVLKISGTMNGILCDTFTSTCLTAGLIEDDQEWKRTLNEAIVWMMPRQLRCLFVHYNRRFGVKEGEKKAYVFINSMLNRERYSLSDFPSMIQISEIDEALLSGESLQTNNLDDPQTYDNKLNVRQKKIVDYILNSINENKNVCTMAYPGIAATLLPNGKTVHKTFGLHVPMFSDSSSRIKPNSKQGEYLKNFDVFIWDEAPMSLRYALEIKDRTLRHIMNNKMPFGGKLMILGGDFRQLFPVQPHTTRTETVNLSIRFSSLWKNFHQFSLTQNMRALPEEIQFVNFLLNIGDRTVNNLNDKRMNDISLYIEKTGDDVEHKLNLDSPKFATGADDEEIKWHLRLHTENEESEDKS
ncbi:uncharacterized protein LOC123264615 [Cotesia glomerata]|uniref:uncharacterized protein LOC123264615 n=1 Tax=Cotesia glomerata TaxID=32391 RepID=UPI001D02070C|nr:uncharacterized protein LOC123264615 [Cotesia glomerata]